MADKKISQLNAHTIPTGSDELVIVSDGETKKITQENLLSNSLFYTNAEPTVVNISKSSNESPLSGSVDGNASGSIIEINNQYTKVIIDAGAGLDIYKNDVVFHVGSGLPGHTGMCLIEMVSTGSNHNATFELWYAPGNLNDIRDSNSSPNYSVTHNYKPLGTAESQGRAEGTDWEPSFGSGGRYTGSSQHWFYYTTLGNNPSGSFYQFAGSTLLNS